MRKQFLFTKPKMGNDFESEYCTYYFEYVYFSVASLILSRKHHEWVMGFSIQEIIIMYIEFHSNIKPFLKSLFYFFNYIERVCIKTLNNKVHIIKLIEAST